MEPGKEPSAPDASNEAERPWRNVPSPLPRKIVKHAGEFAQNPSPSAIARSSFPSPLKSPTAKIPCAFGTLVNRAGANVPSPRFAEKKMKGDRKSTRLNSSHLVISYAVFCLKKKNI